MTNNAELQQIKAIVNQTFKGGQGSGNFGHSGRPGEVGGSAGSFGSSQLLKDKIQSEVDKSNPVKNINNFIGVRDGYVYRFITKQDYDNVLETNKLAPGRALDNGGTVNFSKEPIPVYGGSAFLEAGMLVEVPENKLGDVEFYQGSKDLYAAAHSNIPISSVSRAWGYQFGDPRGVQIIEITNLLKAQKP